MLRYKRCASAGAATRALCERSDRVLVKRKVISCNDGSCVKNKGYIHGALRRLMLRYKRCAKAGATTRALCERGDRILVGR
jgi:hypothetical protein